MVVVVLPTPPFWLHTATTRAGPCTRIGSGSGNTGRGRPVGPSTPGLYSIVRDAATAAAPPRAAARNAANARTLELPRRSRQADSPFAAMGSRPDQPVSPAPVSPAPWGGR